MHLLLCLGLDYCNHLLTVHLILSSSLSREFKTLLQDLFSWHPTTPPGKTALAFQNVLNIQSLFSAINGSGPAYLSELLHVYTPSYTLCTSSDTYILKIQQYTCKSRGFHTSSCFGPHIWNSLPQDFSHCPTLSSFQAKNGRMDCYQKNKTERARGLGGKKKTRKKERERGRR